MKLYKIKWDSLSRGSDKYHVAAEGIMEAIMKLKEHLREEYNDTNAEIIDAEFVIEIDVI